MNIVKFNDIVMTPEVLMELPVNHPLKVDSETGDWVDNTEAHGDSVEDFCEYFNKYLRNKYAYAIRLTHILSMNNPIDGKLYPVGNPFDIDMNVSYVGAEIGIVDTSGLYTFQALSIWMNQAVTLGLMQNEQIRYNHFNEFVPDSDITIEELRVFRQWLATILLENVSFTESEYDYDKLTGMLTYYKQNLKDSTTDALIEFSGYMNSTVLVAGNQSRQPLNLASIGLSAGCGCNTGATGVGNVTATGSCDPLQVYRNAVYNYMVEVFSDVNYWIDQPEICIEMKKYIDGILQAGFPLGSKVINPYVECGCNTFDSDSQNRYRKMLEALSQSLEYIVSGEVVGNKNYISMALSNWAKYLYEYMYWA